MILSTASFILGEYGLVYTRKCGWLDLGHANPEGAKHLWDKILNEKSEEEAEQGFYRISYHQEMRRSRFKVTIRAGTKKWYDIKKGITINEKKSVALAIFLDVSHAFESLQARRPFRWLTDSGYSAEDLVSNLIGFYRALNPHIDYIRVCQPVNIDTALQVWDGYGPVGKNKNHTPIPYTYPTSVKQGSPMCSALPPELTAISPAMHGHLFKAVR